MTPPAEIHQTPAPGTHHLRFRGDLQRFALTVSHAHSGSAWVRTNIGHAHLIRSQIIHAVEKELPPLGQDWFDLPMRCTGPGRYEIILPLFEVGHFEAKCYYLEDDHADPLWPSGDNTSVNIEPAHTCCANLIYNAFVRQFGPGKQSNYSLQNGPDVSSLDKAGYTVIPPSGTFRDLIKELDFIFTTLGCRILQLLPIHPTPTTYARMGRFGSPYAALGFTAVDPALAEFDPQATPLEQFIELVDAVHQRHGRLILDIAINHTGWAASLHETHPQWLTRDSDGRIHVPGAWGVQWEDLTKLNYQHKDLWQYMANVFLTWCRRGVDGFRCDAGYMIPVPAWKYIVASVRRQYPDTIFLLEGLGGKISVTREILNQGNFNWAYSELFQNYDRGQIEHYLPEALDIAASDGIMVHFAETHDNLRLAAKSHTYARLRTDLCALMAPHGAFGFANGVEWFAEEKINVHESPSLNWHAAENQVQNISKLSTLLKHHPVFHDQTELLFIQKGAGNHIALLRTHRPTQKMLLILANLEEDKEVMATWDSKTFNPKGAPLIDLLTEENIAPTEVDGLPACRLFADQVRCISFDPDDIHYGHPWESDAKGQVDRIVHQQFCAKILDIFCAYNQISDMGDVDLKDAVDRLYKDPAAFCRRFHVNGPAVIHWQWPWDERREVMVPPDHFLLVLADNPFRARIVEKDKTLLQEEGLPTENNTWFALFSPLLPTTTHQSRRLMASFFLPDECRHIDAPILYLSKYEHLCLKTVFQRTDFKNRPRLFMDTNHKGGMLRAPIVWGKTESRYDALLAANCHESLPVDRWVMLTGCRAWVVYQDYSQELSFEGLHTFSIDKQGRGLWRFHVPTGQGEHIRITLCLRMVPNQNKIELLFFRHPAEGRTNRLTDEQPVRLILRPDIENRNFHHETKAYMGPEQQWPSQIAAHNSGFTFMPDETHHLHVHLPGGRFVQEPEWRYMVHKSQDEERGFDPHSDHFSPGYFTTSLLGGECAPFSAGVSDGKKDRKNDSKMEKPSPPLKEANLHNPSHEQPFEPVLASALDHFVVKRGPLKSIIAGYPWFLDWGRDALIVVRGLVAAHRIKDAKTVLCQFGRFEENGTLPNMIHGTSAANRDTSDAPLWFFTACFDVATAENSFAFLDTLAGKRSIREILFSIANAYIDGTPNGIKMDLDTALIYSPPHFTWMDTNHPAGTPREGYPIEIQALWYRALTFLSEIDTGKTGKDWLSLAKKVQSSILDIYYLPNKGYLADCLHSSGRIPAVEAVPDDALRPNQLLAITLGAVTDPNRCQQILAACERLLVPGAIRSLADQPLQYPLPIYHNDTLLNDPHHPYQGVYTGDEDTLRKPAYHNGTAWTWIFPSFSEAWCQVYGNASAPTALAWLGSSLGLLQEGCIGQIPEICDGDAPHSQRGCDAQAWGVSELLRVWVQLKGHMAET